MKRLLLFSIIFLCIISCSEPDLIPNEGSIDIQEDIIFKGNAQLKTQEEVNAFGLLGYTAIDGVLNIGVSNSFNYDITDLSRLRSLTRVYANEEGGINSGRVNILYLKKLPSLNGLHNISSVNALRILGCDLLTDLTGLESLKTIGNSNDNRKGLFITGNTSLKSLDGIGVIEKIGIEGNVNASLAISSNHKLKNIQAINSLKTINGNLFFGDNRELQNLSGLQNLTKIVGSMSTSTICSLQSNPFFYCGNLELTDFCALQNLFTNGTYGEVTIELNAYNPTVQDIIEGNCSK